MKLLYLKRILIPALALSAVSLSSCSIINSQFDTEEEGGSVSDADILEIMEKYDDEFKNESYTGPACSIDMVHWDGNGQSIEMSVINTMLKGFKKRYPTISVNLTILSSYEEAYSTRLTGTNIADVFLMPDGDVNQWADLGKCEPLDSYIANSNLVDTSKMYESAMSRYIYDFDRHVSGENGTTIALPKDIGPTVMYYNKSAFKKAGLSYPDNEKIMTMDEAFEMWSKLKQYDSTGAVTMYGVSNIYIEGLVWSAGGDFLNEDRTAFPTDAETLAGLKKGYTQMQRAYCDMGPDESGNNYCCVQPPASWTASADASKLFSNQKVACYIGLKSYVASFRKLDFDWDVCPVPANTVNPEKSAWSGSVGYSIYNGSKYKEASWKLVEYIASKEGQELLSATGFQIPVYPELAEQEDFIERESSNLPSNFKAFLSAAKGQTAGTWTYHANNLWMDEAYNKDCEKLYAEDASERLTVDDFLTKTKPHVNNYIKNY